MRPPAFWSNGKSALPGVILAPAGAIYGSIVRTRFHARRSRTAGIPVICVGNFVLGGAGKTPTALAIAEMVSADGKKPAFLSRGYGGTEPGPALIDLKFATSRRFGDEPLLLARSAPTIVSRDRPQGAELAIRQGADIVVMDDGLQNPSLKKTVSIAVIDSHAGVGNGRIFPAGPLRASIDFQFGLIDAIIVIGDGFRADPIADQARARGIPVQRARLVPGTDTREIRNRKFVAYAGIGTPEKFFASLEKAGAELIRKIPFPDHHRFDDSDAQRLLTLSADQDAQLITTEKDLVRLEGGGHLAALRGASQAFAVKLDLGDPAVLHTLIKRKIGL